MRARSQQKPGQETLGRGKSRIENIEEESEVNVAMNELSIVNCECKRRDDGRILTEGKSIPYNEINANHS